MGLLDRMMNPTGVVEELHRAYDDDGVERIYEKIRQDVQPIIEANKRDLLSGDDGYTPSREFRRAARIPNIVIYQWQQEGVNIWDQNATPEILRRLNSPEWAHLRTAPGRL